VPNFYGPGSGGSAPVADITPTFDFPDVDTPEPKDADPGKFSIDMGNIVGSVGGAIGSAVEFGQGLAGGVAGAVGSIGIPGGPNIGDIGELPGGAVDAIGSIGFGDGKNIGAIPGVVGDVLSAPIRALEGGYAQARLESGGQPTAQALHHLGMSEARGRAAGGIPADIQARLDEGESIEDLANEMVEQGRGFSNEGVLNLASELVFDPLNFIGPGIGKLGSAASKAGHAVAAIEDGEKIGIGTRFMGTAYNAASRGLSGAGGRLMDATIGPATSGIFHALGTKPYQAITSGLSKLSPDYSQAFERAMAVGAAQLPRAVIAREMASDIAMHIQRKGQAILEDVGDIGESIEARLSAIRKLNRSEIERSSEELLLRVAPDFVGREAADVASETTRKLAAIAGTSVEDAVRVLGASVDPKTAQTVHLAFYGKAVDDFGAARAAVATKPNIDVERLTLVAPDTLTVERAAAILEDGPEGILDAVERYGILANRFSGTQFDHAAVREYIEKLRGEGALVDAVKLPKSGKNALPAPLGSWRARYVDFGYDLGFAPKDGLKTIIDPETGDVVYAQPFAHVVTEADPLTMRNPLGRIADSMFRGITQPSIILDSRARFVKATRSAGISPNEARGLHRAVIEEARRQGTSPRGLDPDAYRELFERYLGPARYAEFAPKMDPTFAVMKAFQGNLARVGVTQWLTGTAKTAVAEKGNVAATIAEKFYPTIRFRLSPLFQLQELLESPFWNALRGVRVRPASDEIASLYGEISELPELRHFNEAGYFLHMWGGKAIEQQFGANTILGRALSRVPNIAGAKRKAQAAQIASEHPEAFEKAINAINPRYWRAMTEAYGTTDPGAIAHAFLSERFDLTDPAALLEKFDGIAPKTFASADEETVWAAFRESLRQTSQQAFKTHFFDPRRGWLERSLNHPYLGLYPLSYMWGKVLPEFARFLLKRPFGLNAPLVGYAAFERVQQAVVGAIATDPELARAVDDNSDLIYAFETLLPGTPGNLPANAPAWARHLAEDNLAGRKFDPQRFVTREAADAVTYAAGPVRSLNVAAGALGDLGDVASDLYASLDKAAAEYDAFVLPAR
jgi:hypothetical protein